MPYARFFFIRIRPVRVKNETKNSDSLSTPSRVSLAVTENKQKSNRQYTIIFPFSRRRTCCFRCSRVGFLGRYPETIVLFDRKNINSLKITARACWTKAAHTRSSCRSEIGNSPRFVVVIISVRLPRIRNARLLFESAGERNQRAKHNRESSRLAYEFRFENVTDRRRGETRGPSANEKNIVSTTTSYAVPRVRSKSDFESVTTNNSLFRALDWDGETRVFESTLGDRPRRATQKTTSRLSELLLCSPSENKTTFCQL